LNIEFAAKPCRATIVTLVMIGYSAGIAVGGPISNWLIPLYGWRSVFILGGVLSLLSAGVLIAMLPESVRFLASKGADPSRIAAILRRVAPRELILDSARFILTDEATARANFRVPMLFAGLLRYMTPLLWVAYIFSSITAFFLATWTPLVFEALHFTRADAALAGSVNAAMGAIGGILLMRFTDRLGAIAIVAMPLCAIPLLLILGLADLPPAMFLALNALAALALIGGHFGMHSIAGIFYPSAIRGNGAGWATSVAKIGSILGPWAGGVILATGIATRHIFAILAICPAMVLICVFFLGLLHRGLTIREHEREAPGAMRQAA
jgi:AAHS family 4-hydroxybenzoate transporter-like MFS transporter